jgi:hypothetical protein
MMNTEFFRQICILKKTVAEAVKWMLSDPYTGARMTYFGDGNLAVVAILSAPTQENLLVSATMLTITIPVLAGMYALMKYRRQLKHIIVRPLI